MEKAWTVIKNLWPISLLLMAFTFLAELEKFTKFSAYLSYIVHIWRDLLHSIFEAPLNFILSLFDIPNIDIPSPIPEVLFFMTLFLTAVFRENKFNRLQFWLEGKFPKATFAALLSMLSTVSFVLLFCVLFADWFDTTHYLIGTAITLFGFTIILSAIPTFIDNNRIYKEYQRTATSLPFQEFHRRYPKKRVAGKILKSMNAFFGILLPIVVLLSAILIISSNFLEMVIPVAEDFNNEAIEHSKRKL